MAENDCSDDIFKQDNLIIIFNSVLQVVIIVLISQAVYLFVRPLGQPLSIAQLLAGLLIGDSGLSQIPAFKEFMFPDYMDYLILVAKVGQVSFMFLIALELDIDYLKRTRYRAVAITMGGNLVCTVLAAIFNNLVYRQTGAHGGRARFFIILMLALSNTASPVLARMAAELKVATLEVGRVAIASAVINDVCCLFIVAVMDAVSVEAVEEYKNNLPKSVGVVVLVAATACASRPMVRWVNRRHRKRKDLMLDELGIMLMLVGMFAVFIELLEFNSMIPCFILGLVLPREGRVVRTLTARLTGPMYNIIFPVYFGYNGMKANLRSVAESKHLLFAAITVVVLSIIGKVLGTLATAHYYFKMSVSEGLVLGFLLNVKGHIAFQLVQAAKNFGIWDEKASNVIKLSMVLTTIIAGPSVAIIKRRERKSLAYQYLGLESQKPQGSELRMLACVHGPQNLPTIINLIETSRGTDKSPLTAYLLHLVELTNKVPVTMFYHQKDDDEEDEYLHEDYGGEDEQHINDAIDAFTAESGIIVRQLIAVSAFSNMHEDVCNAAEDLRASIIILPFHRHQRVDGKMEDGGKEGHRITNQNVINKAKCTVGILIDRGLGGTTQLSATNASQHFVVLFFGGADDREALAYGGRIAEHPDVSLTLIRFLPLSTRDYETGIGMESAKDDEVLMRISNLDRENDSDRAFLSTFYNRYVTTGIVSYIEKFVENGAQTVSALSAMDGMVSLFIVGKGGRDLSPLTAGINDWIEFPELGVIGDLLASSDFTVSGSVLVVQQYNPIRKDVINDEFIVERLQS